jgi:hypothetical protein
MLAKNPRAATEDALVKYVTRSKSVALQRFLDLSDQAAAASAASIKKDPLALAGPTAIFRGIAGRSRPPLHRPSLTVFSQLEEKGEQNQ